MVFMSPWMGENYERICVYVNIIFYTVPPLPSTLFRVVFGVPRLRSLVLLIRVLLR
jgi:hypothetical protein